MSSVYHKHLLSMANVANSGTLIPLCDSDIIIIPTYLPICNIYMCIPCSGAVSHPHTMKDITFPGCPLVALILYFHSHTYIQNPSDYLALDINSLNTVGVSVTDVKCRDLIGQQIPCSTGAPSSPEYSGAMCSEVLLEVRGC